MSADNLAQQVRLVSPVLRFVEIGAPAVNHGVLMDHIIDHVNDIDTEMSGPRVPERARIPAAGTLVLSDRDIVDAPWPGLALDSVSRDGEEHERTRRPMTMVLLASRPIRLCAAARPAVERALPGVAARPRCSNPRREAQEHGI